MAPNNLLNIPFLSVCNEGVFFECQIDAGIQDSEAAMGQTVRIHPVSSSALESCHDSGVALSSGSLT